MRHVQRVAKYGTIHPATGKLNRERYLWSFVQVPERVDGCWMWTGTLTEDGYGWGAFMRSLTPGGSALAHRAVFELYAGPIPPDLVLDHLCRVPRCVNPEHLEPVTNLENSRRGLHGVLRTHCAMGHELSTPNLYVRPGSSRRECRECKRTNSRLSARRVRARRRVVG
jgi:hypothetical protein